MTNKKGFLQNSAWGLASNILQNLFLSVFFVIIVNKLSLQDYSNYLIANSLYQAVASFSALGLGQWFIRQLNEETDFGFFLNKFLKIQILAGLFFYAFYLGFIYLLYDDNTVRILGILIGVNIVFDNIIYGVKHLNIAQFEQNKTFIVLIIEAVAKLLLGLVIYIYPYTVIEMTVVLVILRIITLNLFLKISTSKLASIQSIIRLKISYSDFKKLGELMSQTHIGLSKEYEVSCEEIDFLVASVRHEKSVLGARMMGGGFGGCTINLVKTSELEAFQAALKSPYEKAFQKIPEFILVEISEGARVL